MVESLKNTPALKSDHAPAAGPNLMVEMIAGASSIAMGALTAWRLVMERSFSNFSTLHLTEDIKKQRDDWGKNFAHEMEAGHYTREEAQVLIKEQSKRYQNALTERFEKGGYTSFAERVKLLHPHQKMEAIVTPIAVTGVALGSILLLTKDLFKNVTDKIVPNDCERS